MLLDFSANFHYCAVLLLCPESRPASAGPFYPSIPGFQDYHQIENNSPGSILSCKFEDTRHSQTFNVVIYEDEVPEGVEELNITLSLQDPHLANRVTVMPAVASVRIRDNDSKFVMLNVFNNWRVDKLSIDIQVYLVDFECVYVPVHACM